MVLNFNLSIFVADNPKQIKEKILLSNLSFKEIAYAQAIEESAWFKSRRTKECNNIFGIKVSKHPLQIGKSNNYGCYKSIEDCIKHYKHIQSVAIKKYHIKNEHDYFKYLKRVYAKNPRYVRNIKSIRNKIFK